MRTTIIFAFAFFCAVCCVDPNANAVCVDGACCLNGQFKPTRTKCSYAINPCEVDSECTGYSPVCPERAHKADGTTCNNNGHCKAGICYVPSCTGLCCKDHSVVPDGTQCGTEGKCVEGTCVVVLGSEKKTKEEKEIIELVRGVVDKDIDELLSVHEHYVLQQRELGMPGYADETIVSQISKIKSLFDPYVASANEYNIVALAADRAGVEGAREKNGSNLSWVGYAAAGAGILLIAGIAFFIFRSKPKDDLEYESDMKKNDDYEF